MKKFLKSAFFTIFVFLCLINIACVDSSRSAAEKKKFPDAAFGELWFNIYDSTGKIGYMRRERIKTTFEGLDAIIFRVETFIRNSAGYDKSVAETYYDYNFKPLQEIIIESGSSESSFSVRKDNGNFVFHSVISSFSSELTMPIEENLYAQPDSLFISEVSDFATVKCIDARYQKVHEFSIKYLGKEKIDISSNVIEASKYLIKSSILSESDVIMWIDGNKNECMCESAGLKFVRADKQSAEKKDGIKNIDGHIASVQKMDSSISEALSIMKVEYSSRDKRRSFVFPSNEYQTPSKEGKKLYLRLYSPNSKREQAEYPPEALKPSKYIQSDDDDIKEKAAEFKQENLRETVSLIRSWVYGHIKEAEFDTYLSAVEALRFGKGDCTEKSLLFAALTRSLGIPSRIISGFIFDGGCFILHSWAEVWLNGKWIAVDPSYNKSELGARYIYLSSSYGGDISPSEGIKMLDAVNNLNFNIRSVYVKNKWFHLKNPSEFFKHDKNNVSQRLWGIKFDNPKNWRFTADESKLIKGTRGDALIFITLFSPLEQDIGKLVSVLTGHSVDSFKIADMFPRVLSDGRRSLLYSSFISKNKSDFTCMVYITENLEKDKMVMSVLICPQDKSNMLMSELDAINLSLVF